MVADKVLKPFRYLATIGIAFTFATSTHAKKDEVPPNSPPPLSEAERDVGISGVKFSDVIERAGTPTIAPGAVLKGQPLLSIPFKYRYTAVLTEDVLGFSFTVGGIQGRLCTLRHRERRRPSPPFEREAA